MKRLSIVLLICFLVTIPVMSVGAQPANNPSDPSNYEVEASESQIDAYYTKVGEKRPYVDKLALNKILKSYTVSKKEKFVDEKGRQNEVKYYRIDFKNTKEAEDVLKTKAKYTDKNKIASQEFSTLGFTPMEGDFRINWVATPMTETTKFDDSTTNYQTAFTAEQYKKVFSLASGYLVSNPIISFFTGEVLDDLNNSFKGNGKAIGAQRLVYKYGQVYHNNTWVNYYETYQREDYWAHDQVSYNSNGSVKSAEYKRYWPESYWPFQWIRTGDFSKNSSIAEVALYQYSVEPNRTSPTRDFYRYEGGLQNWATPGSFPY